MKKQEMEAFELTSRKTKGGGPQRVEVEASLVGPFAIHRNIVRVEKGVARQGQVWVVTTADGEGLLNTDFRKADDAVAFAKALDKETHDFDRYGYAGALEDADAAESNEPVVDFMLAQLDACADIGWKRVKSFYKRAYWEREGKKAA